MLDTYSIYDEITGWHNIVLVMEWKWLISEERKRKGWRDKRGMRSKERETDTGVPGNKKE